VTIQNRDDPIFKWSFFGRQLCLVFECTIQKAEKFVQFLNGRPFCFYHSKTEQKTPDNRTFRSLLIGGRLQFAMT
jgi:hypothetical protein